MSKLTAAPSVAAEVEDGVEGFAFSPDANRLVAVAEDRRHNRRLLVFELGHTRPLRAVSLPGTKPSAGEALSMSPDGMWVCVSRGHEQGIAVFDTKTGTERGHARPDDRGRATAVAWNPNGSSVSVATGPFVEHWDVRDGALSMRARRQVARVQGAWVPALAWHPDGTHFAASSSAPAVYAFGASLGSRMDPAANAAELAWSDDGALLAAREPGGGGRVVVWTDPVAQIENPVGPKAEARTFAPRGSAHYTGIAWEPGGRGLAISDSEGRVDVFSVGTGDVTQAVAADAKAPIRHLAWRGDYLVAWAGWPAKQFLVWHRPGASAWSDDGSPTSPPERPPRTRPSTGTATVVVRAIGPRAELVPTLWSAALVTARGVRHASEPFDRRGRVVFERVPAGAYRVVFDTRADVAWGPAPRTLDVRCRDGAREELVVTFA